MLSLENATAANISGSVPYPPATVYRKVAGTVIFVIVWPFIVLDMKWFPLGRPAAALMGAALMVIFTVVPQNQAIQVIGEAGNVQTISLLVGMMLLSYYYDREGLLQAVSLWIFGKDKPFKHILWKVCTLSAVLSAIITNDATCIVITPLILNEHITQERSHEELLPLLLGIATSANIGSAATFFGNPQNAFIAANSDVSLITFFATTLPAAILGMLINIGLLYFMTFPPTWCRRVRLTQLGDRVRQDVQPLDKETDETTDPQLHSNSRPNGGVKVRSFRQSLAESRENLAKIYDQSGDPHPHSQLAQERERMYEYQSNVGDIPSFALPQNRYSYSLPRNFRTGHGRSGSYKYGATHHSSSNSSDQNVPLREVDFSGQAVDSTMGISPSATAEQRLEEGLDETNFEIKEPEECLSAVQIFKNKGWRAKCFIVWLSFITFTVVALLAVPPLPNAEFNLGLVPLGAGILTMFVDTIVYRRYAYGAMTKIDWTVILMFWGLFVWLEGFENTRFPDGLFNWLKEFMDLSQVQGVLLFVVFVVIGSNVLSNVPLVILVVNELSNFRCGSTVCPPQLTGVLLAWVSTIAGNFTLIGSVANLIVAEKARSCAGYILTFWGYLKFGFFSTILVLFSGLPVVYFAGRGVDI